jgi:hypothetical protein
MSITATCRTKGCENAGTGIDITELIAGLEEDAPPPSVWCGACGTPITDLTGPGAPA